MSRELTTHRDKARVDAAVSVAESHLWHRSFLFIFVAGFCGDCPAELWLSDAFWSRWGIGAGLVLLMYSLPIDRVIVLGCFRFVALDYSHNTAGAQAVVQLINQNVIAGDVTSIADV